MAQTLRKKSDEENELLNQEELQENSLSEKQGYVKKPFQIYFVGCFLILMPLFSFLRALQSFGVAEWYHPGHWNHFLVLIPASSWLLIGLTMLAGASVLFVKKTSLFISAASLFFIFSINLATNNKAMLIALIIPAIFFLTSFRTPYFRAELRWWEQFPRYLLNNHRARVVLGLQHRELSVVNISQSGALLDTQFKGRLPEIGERLSVELDSGIQLTGTVVRLDGSRFGLHFDSLSRKERNKLRDFVSEAKIQGSLYRS